MNRLKQKKLHMLIRKNRVRAKVYGTKEMPRFSIFISNRHVFAQIIDDDEHTTLVAVTTVGNKAAVGNMTQKAQWIGTQIAKKAKSKKISKVVFDRNGRLYHGRAKALADAARQEGLEF